MTVTIEMPARGAPPCTPPTFPGQIAASVLQAAAPGVWITQRSLAFRVYGHHDWAEREAIKVLVWRLRHSAGLEIETRRGGTRRGCETAYRLVGRPA